MFKVLKISGIQKIFTLWITVIWRGELKTIGITQGSVLGPSSILFPWYTKSMGFVIHSHGLSNHLCRDDTQQIQFHILKPSLQLKYLCNWPTPPTYNSFWTILSCSSFQGRHLPSTNVLPDTLGQWTWVWHWMTSWPFAASIATTTLSCRFLLYNTMRIIMFLTQKATKVLVRALSFSWKLLSRLPLVILHTGYC